MSKDDAGHLIPCSYFSQYFSNCHIFKNTCRRWTRNIITNWSGLVVLLLCRTTSLAQGQVQWSCPLGKFCRIAANCSADVNRCVERCPTDTERMIQGNWSSGNCERSECSNNIEKVFYQTHATSYVLAGSSYRTYMAIKRIDSRFIVPAQMCFRLGFRSRTTF